MRPRSRRRREAHCHLENVQKVTIVLLAHRPSDHQLVSAQLVSDAQLDQKLLRIAPQEPISQDQSKVSAFNALLDGNAEPRLQFTQSVE